MTPSGNRDRQLRRRFMFLFDRATEGDDLSRAAIVDEWPALRLACSDQLDALTKHYYPPYANVANWLTVRLASPDEKAGQETIATASSLLQVALARETPDQDAPRQPVPRESKASKARKQKSAKFAGTPCRAFVDVDDAIAVHYRLVNDFMFSPDPILPAGIRSMDLLSSAVNRQHTSFGGQRKYTTVPEVAASLLYGIVLDHAFHNGNKRTGLVLMLQLLDRNHAYLEGSDADLFNFLLDVASHRMGGSKPDEEVRAIGRWLADHMEHLDKHEYPLTVRDLIPRLERFGCRVTRIGAKTVSFAKKGHPTKRIGFTELGQVVDPGTVHRLRRDLGLLEREGITSGMFYGDQETLDIWINKYRKLLRDLAHV